MKVVFGFIFGFIFQFSAWGQPADWIEGYPAVRFFQSGADYQGSALTYAIIEDDDGTILFGNDNVGAQQIDGTHARAILYPRRVVASSFQKDPFGTIYSTGSAVFGYLYRGENGAYRFRSLTGLIADSAHVVPFLHRTVRSGNAGNMLFLGQEQAYLYVREKAEIRLIEPEGRFFDARHIEGSTWLTDTVSGLHLMDENGQLISVSTPFPAAENRILNIEGMPGIYTVDHELWILEDGRRWHNKGTFSYYSDKDRFHILSAGTLSDGSVIMTSLSGVQIFDISGTLLHNFNQSNILPFDIAGQAYEATDGTIWVSSPDGLAAIMFSSPQRRFIENQGIPSGQIWSVDEWQRNVIIGTNYGLWMGDYDNFSQVIPNLVVFDLAVIPAGLLVGSTRGLALLTNEGNLLRITDDAFIRSVFRDPQHPNTVYFYDSPNQINRLVLQDDSQAPQITPLHSFSLNPKSFAKVSDTEFWIGTTNSGIFRFTGEADQNGLITINQKTFWGNSYGLAEDGTDQVLMYEGELLFTTANGVKRLNTGKDGLEPHPDFAMPGLNGDAQVTALYPFPNDSSSLIAFIPPSRFLMLTRSSAGEAFDIQYLPITTRGREGYLDLTFGDSGRVYKVMRSGVSYLDPAVFGTDLEIERELRLHITQVTALPDSVLHHGWTEKIILENPRIGWETNDLRFSWSLISFQAKGSQYQFRLLGAGEEWSAWTNETYADFRNLREGSYVFEVRGRTLAGQLSPVAAVAFSVIPPWYRSNLAYFAYLTLFLGFVLLLFQWRTHNIRMRQKELEALVLHRTREIDQKNIQLEKLDKVKSRLFSGISHEFRTPLTLIKGPADLLRLQGMTLTEEERRSSANMIIANADRLLLMVDEVLNLSKMESGTFSAQIEEVALSKIINKVTAWYKPLAAQKNLTLRLHVDPALKNKTGFFDVRQMELLLSNLLSNAVKYTDKGYVNVKLMPCPETDGGMELTIEDSGIGIAEEEIPLVFNRFYRSSGAMGLGPGTGIGLSLVQFIAEIHSIDLQLSSQAGAGTTVKALIPGRIDNIKGDYVQLMNDFNKDWQENENDALSENAFEGQNAEDGALLRMPDADVDIPVVLVVDDNPDIRRFVRRSLGTNFQFAECINGHEALALSRTLLPDIILTDVMMPELDGFAFTRQLRKYPETRHIPVIVITAKGSESSELEGLQAGASDYITKPFSPSVLKARVEGQLVLQRELRNWVMQKQQKITTVRKTTNKSHPGQSAAATKTENPKPAEKTAFLLKTEQTIRANIANPDFNVELLAVQLNMSRSTLNRKLRQQTTENAQDIMKRVRLEEAKKLLEAGEPSITQVAYAVGYNSLSYFSRAFKECHGCNPSDCIIK